LRARLEAGAPRLTVIAALPGFGKTSVALGWIVGAGRRAAWLSLDADDNTPRLFWRYRRAEEHAAEAWRVLAERGAGDWPAAGFADLAQAMVRYARGDLGAAAQLADRAHQRGKEGQIVDILFDADLLRAAIATALH